MQLATFKSANGRVFCAYGAVIFAYVIICQAKSERFLADFEI